MNPYNIYRPLVERNQENFQVQHLARRYDFGKESRIAALIVREVNRRMDEVEERLGMKRAKPFELCWREKGKDIMLPLFRPEYLEPILARKTFSQSRSLVIDACMEQFRKQGCKADTHKVLSIIDPWSQIRKKGPNRYIDNLQDTVIPLDETDTAAWAKQLESIKPKSPTARLGVLDVQAPEKVVKGLVEFTVAETDLGPVAARQMVEELIVLRNISSPLTRHLKNGEMPVMATHVRANLSDELATRFRRHAPVIVTVWTPDELKRRPKDVPGFLEQLKRRIVRVCFEAYRQDGLLNLMDLQWIFQISTSRISELIRSFQKEHNIVVPTPGTVLDAGRSMTHKDIIVNLHLEGYTVKEIARITHHSPRSVDNYIRTFQGVLILSLYRVPPELMAGLLQKSLGLVKEHLELVQQFYPDQEQLRKHLRDQGVNIQTIIS